MSRLKDLRELICVSRLTYRESDDEVLSDDDTTVAIGKLTVSDVDRGASNERVDSGVVLNGQLSTGTSSKDSASSTLDTDSDSQRIKRRRRKKKRDRNKPVASSASAANGESPVKEECDLDELLCYIDSTIVSEWLVRANGWVNDLSVWCHTGLNYVDLANFILTEFPDIQRQKILELEYSIFMDELTIAFSAGRQAGCVNHRKLQHLALAVFREYPGKLLSQKGKPLLLDYLDILSSERRECYRTLLSDVKISTKNRQHAQLLLAIRAFGLASLWFAVVNFYRKLKSVNSGVSVTQSVPSTAELLELTTKDQSQNRLLQAIKCEYIQVIDYFLKSGKISCRYRDLHQRSLLHLAIMNNRERVLEYLLTQTDCSKDVNHCADNGNSPLHAAINNGNQSMVRLLIKKSQADCNLCNPLCDNAAPIHVAVMHGYKTIVTLLLDAGANPDLKMGDLDAMAMAEEFGLDDIKELLANRRLSD